MTENRYIDDAGTLIDKKTGQCYDYPEEVVSILNNKEEQLKEYEKLIKEILLETRGHITERKYYALVGVSPQTYYTLKNLIQEW